MRRRLMRELSRLRLERRVLRQARQVRDAAPPPICPVNADNGRAVIRGGVIVISVPVENLPAVVEGSWAAGGMEKRYTVTDAEDFAKDLVRELNREDEIGTTPIHRLFDRSIEEAIGQGAFGVEEHSDQGDGCRACFGSREVCPCGGPPCQTPPGYGCGLQPCPKCCGEVKS
jgi:hypothetical protein